MIWIMYRDGSAGSTGTGYFFDDFSMVYDAVVEPVQCHVLSVAIGTQMSCVSQVS